MTTTVAGQPVVHTWDPNSNSGKPLFVLSEKGIDFDYRYIDLLRFEQHGPDYVKLNPRGTVPTLEHRGATFTESTPMCEYLDAAVPGPSLVPSDAAGRYEMRRWCRLCDQAAESVSVIGWHNYLGPMVRSIPKDEFERLLERIPTKERRISWAAAARAEFSAEQLQGARDAVGAFVRRMDDRLAERTWLASDSFTLADLLTFTNFYALPLSFPEFGTDAFASRVMEWLRRIYARPATMRTFGMARSIARRAFEVRDLIGAPRDGSL